MTLYPDVNLSPPDVESYTYYGHSGYPSTADNLNLTPQEYRDAMVQSVRSCFGNFETADPEQKFFGRTMHEVLTKAQTGEYRITSMNQQWVRCDRFGVRILQYLQWSEYSDRTRPEAVQPLLSTQKMKTMKGR